MRLHHPMTHCHEQNKEARGGPRIDIWPGRRPLACGGTKKAKKAKRSEAKAKAKKKRRKEAKKQRREAKKKEGKRQKGKRRQKRKDFEDRPRFAQAGNPGLEQTHVDRHVLSNKEKRKKKKNGGRVSACFFDFRPCRTRVTKESRNTSRCLFLFFGLFFCFHFFFKGKTG